MVNWLKRWFKVRSGRTLEVTPRGVASDYWKPDLRKSGLRPGMWVLAEGRVGVLVGVKPGGTARVMTVKPDGTNLIGLELPVAKVEQARYEDIPEKRRPDAATAMALGYKARAR